MEPPKDFYNLSFKDRVIEICKQIPYGKVTTYGTLATLAGSPRGARIVGGILHSFAENHNLPWQRVINRHGFISIKNMEHPKELQKVLLEQEGIEVSKDFMIDLDKYYWGGIEKIIFKQLMKKLWIIANFKSNKKLEDVLDWIGKVGPKLEKRDDLQVVVCPTYSSLEQAKKAIMVGNFQMLIGSQNLSPFGEGAYTGEEPASIIKSFIDLSIIGHSERRKNFGETDQTVADKTKIALAQEIIPLVCVQDADTPVPESCLLVAYEPVFAIGTGNPDTPENADLVAEKLKKTYGQNVEVLYGGSINSQNAGAFVQKENISGLLIGKASLDADEFLKIIESCIK